MKRLSPSNRSFGKLWSLPARSRDPYPLSFAASPPSLWHLNLWLTPRSHPYSTRALPPTPCPTLMHLLASRASHYPHVPSVSAVHFAASPPSTGIPLAATLLIVLIRRCRQHDLQKQRIQPVWLPPSPTPACIPAVSTGVLSAPLSQPNALSWWNTLNLRTLTPRLLWSPRPSS